MNRTVKEQILQKIQAYSRIILFRHIRSDGDCIGATKGLRRILALTWPEKDIRIVDPGTMGGMAFLGTDDLTVPDEVCADALGIVLDTATADRISHPAFAHCRELIKIDHHIPTDHYADLIWVEEERSSCCEMIVDFYLTFRDTLKIDTEAAACLYTGMVTDSGRFKHRGVSGDTLRCAAALLDLGIDTDTLYAQLYLEPFEALKFKAHIYERMQITPNGVAHIRIDAATRAAFGLSFEQACACISYLDGIRGCICWIAFIDNDDEAGSVRVRLRSRFVEVNSIAERYRGGGHACACGATVYGDEEIAALLADADELVGAYKATHTGWL